MNHKLDHEFIIEFFESTFEITEGSKAALGMILELCEEDMIGSGGTAMVVMLEAQDFIMQMAYDQKNEDLAKQALNLATTAFLIGMVSVLSPGFKDKLKAFFESKMQGLSSEEYFQ